MCVPAVHEAPHVQAEEVVGLLDELAAGHHEFVIFATGVEGLVVARVAQESVEHAELVVVVAQRLTTVCRWSQADVALRGASACRPTLSAREPFTTESDRRAQ